MLAPGIGRWIYWPIRALLTPIAKLTLHPMLVGRRSIPTSGPVIVAANHRSWVDPFVIAMLSRRKMYFVAKAELFQNRLVGWFLAAVGVFPVRRGAGDRKMLTTALEILRRGECLMIFPEGTRGTEAGLGKPLAGFGKLAQRTGAQVVPVAVSGTCASDRQRFGLRRVVVSAAAPVCCSASDATGGRPDRELLDRVWGEVENQWELACALSARP